MAKRLPERHTIPSDLAADAPEAEPASPAPATTAALRGRPAPLEAAICRKVEALIAKRHRAHLAPDEEITVAGELSHGHAQVSCEIVRRDRTFRLFVETCVECEPNDLQNPLEARDAALDYLDLVLIEFFAKDRFLHFRPVWQEYEREGITVLMRGQITNPQLEDEADRLLAEHGFDKDGEES